MFDFLKNIFDNRSNSFTKDEASISITDDEMALVRNGHKQTMNLSLLNSVKGYVSDDKSERKINGLFLESETGHSLFVPSFADGYNLLTETLCERCNLSIDVFSQWHKKARGHRWLIWKKYDINNVVLTSPKDDKAAKEMYYNGLWIEATKSMFLWSTFISDALAFPFISNKYHKSGKPTLVFETTVFIGSVGINNLHVHATDQRLDVPARYYTAKILIDGPGDNNYYRPKQAWTSLMGIPQHCHEDGQQLFCAWDFEDIRLSLSYTYDGPSSACSGEATLHIDNGRSYPQCWQDDDYERNFTVNAKLNLPISYHVAMDWRQNPYVRPTPDGIMRSYVSNDLPYAIWMDNVNAKIGFANAMYAVVIPRHSLKNLSIEVWMPDKGEEVESLLVNIEYMDSHFNIVVATGCVDDVWKFKNDISSFLGMSIDRVYV